MKTELQRKIKAYSLAAGAIAVSTANSDAQNYTDITPDKVMDISGVGTGSDSLMIDLNNDMTDDFKIKAGKWSTAAGGGTVYVAPVGANGAVNAAAAVNPSSAYMAYAAVANDLNTPICPSLGWDGTALIAGGTPASHVGPWKNKTDKYLGLRIYTGGDTLYGWVRMDFSGMVLTVKDFAVNPNPQTCINAGQQIVGLGEQLEQGTTISATSNNEIIVRREDLALSNGGTVEVLDINTRIVASGDLNGVETSLTVSGQAAGIYLVRVSYDAVTITRKVYLD